MRRIPVILDGDPGHDDAIAWMLAAALPQLDIKAVVSVGGNVSLEKTTLNSLRILTLLGRTDIPVAKGFSRPLFCEPMDAPSVHGESGLDGPEMPQPAIELSDMPGVRLMADIIRESPQKVTLVPTGPLTNIAVLLSSYPELKEKIEVISLMGGGILMGNWTPAAEFNILVDPEAAKMVFASGVPIIMAPLDVTEKALVKAADVERIRLIGNEVSRMVAEWLDFFYKFHRSLGYDGAPLHDPCAVGVLVRPEIFKAVDMYVDVETVGEYSRGATIGDYHHVSGNPPNAKVILDVDRDAFVDMIVDACAFYAGR